MAYVALFSPRRLPVFFKESHSDSRTWIRNRTRESYTSVVAERTTCTLTCTHNPPLPPNFPPNLTNTHLPACVSRKSFHILRITPLCIIRKLKLHSREAYIRELLIREPLRDDRPSSNISHLPLSIPAVFFVFPLFVPFGLRFVTLDRFAGVAPHFRCRFPPSSLPLRESMPCAMQMWVNLLWACFPHSLSRGRDTEEGGF